MRYNFLPSFARRKGRITKLQEKNLSFLADYSLNDPNTLKYDPSFDKIALEIGFGNGEDFFSFAQEKNNTLFLASEVYKSGIGNLIGKIKEHSLENIYIHEGDIRDLIFVEKVLNLMKFISYALIRGLKIDTTKEDFLIKISLNAFSRA